MAFEFPSVETKKKLAKKKAKEAKEKKQQEDFAKTISPVYNKKGFKGTIAEKQFESAMDNVPSDGGKLVKTDKEGNKSRDLKKIKKIVDAATDDNQLGNTERKLTRDVFRGGGRAGYKMGSKGCKLATKGKGRAYGQNS